MFTAKRKGLLVFLAALFIAALIGVGIIFAPAFSRNIPVSAAAGDHIVAEGNEKAVAKVTSSDGSKTYYDSLLWALDGASSGSTVDILKDVSDSTEGKRGQIEIINNGKTEKHDCWLYIQDKTLTINGNGYTLTSTACSFAMYAVNLTGSEYTLTLNDVNIVSKDSSRWPLWVCNNKFNLKLDNVKLTNAETSVSGSKPVLMLGGNANTGTVTIDNSELVGGDIGYAIVSTCPVDINVTKTTLEGRSAVYMRSGSSGAKVNISDSTINTSSALNGENEYFGTFTFEPNNIAFSVKDSKIEAAVTGNAAQYVVYYSRYTQPADVKSIDVNFENTDVTLKGNKNVLGFVGGYIESAKDVDVQVNGGTFERNVNGVISAEILDEEFLPEGVEQSPTGEVIKTENIVAEIDRNGTKWTFSSLADAVAAANNGETVALVKDITISSGSAVIYSAGSPLDKAITIDLAGNTITSSASDYVFDISTTKDFTITSSVDGGTINASAALQLKSNKVKETKDAGAEIATVNFNVSNVKFTGEYKFNNPLLFDNKYQKSVQQNVILDDIIVEYESDNGNATFKVIENKNYSNLEIKDSKITVTDNSKSRKKGAPFYAVYNSSYNYGGEFSISNSTITTDGRKGMPTQYGLGGPVASIGVDLTVTNSTISSADGPGITFYGSMITEQALAAGAEKDYKTLTISGGDITGYTFALSGNGDGSYEGTNITVKDGAKLTATIGAGIYQPQVGILNIEGKGTSVTGSSGIEIRAGELNVKDAAITATAEKFSVIANGGGTTTDGAAIVVAQHSQRAEKWLPISVNLESGTYKGIKAVYQADVLQNGDEAVKEIEMSLIGGEYNGEVESENVTGFIAGGTFSQAVDESYMADGFAMEEYNGTYIVVKEEPEVAPTIAERVNAQAEVRAYMAAFGLKLSDMQALAGEDGNAAAIVDAYDSLMGAGTATLLAEAKLAAMDAVDAFIDALNAAKADAVEQIVEYAANAEEGIVTVPTYVLSAINGAASAAEVQTYFEAAKAEIDEVREQRAAAEEQANALAEKVAGIIEALKITEGEEGAWSTTLLGEVMEQLNAANTDIDSILGLIGQPAEGDKNNTIFDMIKDVDGDIATAVEDCKEAVDSALNNISDKFDSISQKIEALPEYSEQFKTLTEAVGKVQTAVDNANDSLGSLTTEVGSINTTVESMQTVQNTMNEAFTAFGEQFNKAVADMEGRFDALDSAIAALPDSTEVAGIVQDMQKQFTGLGGKIDALTGTDGALTQIDGKIDALDEVVDGIASVQNTMNEAFTAFGEQFNAAVADMEGRFDALDTAIGALPDNTQAIAELKTALAEAQKGITAANEGIAQLGTDLGTVEGKVDAIDSTADSVLAAQNALKTAVEGYKAAADEALADISDSRDALDKDLALLTASTAADKEALSKEIAALQTTANKLEDAVAALDGDSQADLTAITEDLAGLQTSLDGLKADIQKVAQSVTAVEEDSVNSASGFAGLYVFISALVVLVVAVLVVVSLKKRA